MTLSKEQAEAAFDAVTAPARQEQAMQAAAFDLQRRKIMPLRWRLYAVLAGLSIGAFLYRFAFAGAEWSIWIVPLGLFLSVSFAQFRWNKRIET